MLERHVLGGTAPAIAALSVALLIGCGGKSRGSRAASGGADDPEALIRAYVASAVGGGDLGAFFPSRDVVSEICDGDAAAVTTALEADVARQRADHAEVADMELEVLGVTVPSSEPQRWTIQPGEVWRGSWAEGACKVRQSIDVVELTVAMRMTYQGESREDDVPTAVIRIGERWYMVATPPARERTLSPLEAALDQCRAMYAHAQRVMDLREASDEEVLGLCKGTSRAMLACILAATDEAAIDQCTAAADEALCDLAGEARYFLMDEVPDVSEDELRTWIDSCPGNVPAVDAMCIVDAEHDWEAAQCTKPFYE